MSINNNNDVFWLFFYLVLPTIRARQSDVNATAEVGSSAMLACDADGFPEPMVTWIQYVTDYFKHPGFCLGSIFILRALL